ncbi:MULTISPECIES: LysR family transcriptional regulator [unclassified Nocardioides]|uniref:LysR family transcriptional regulator n=1 Tax=unclassified Nocardioides TaxID=2615069 RepID=UPI0009EFA0F7|nr:MULTISPECIES: LysR family transcriptional regulator [unclassified Nocardioides]GAW47729.1 LysR family transcriptional regulator [Nocardioides sp. PD653-B2]GAW56225.1 LysR family transcriptional regulator [Nocardioides sp. PD653]
MTPTQLRAFACVVRWGSVKGAAGELGVSEAAVSMHVAHLRKELDDDLFTRTSSGLAFTPGGLRLASRAVEILGLQDRTVQEVSQAGHGRRVLRVATSSLFAEHAAPGLFELFASRADDLDVELSVRPAAQFPALLAARTVDVTIGPALQAPVDPMVHLHFLLYEVLAVTRPDHPRAGQRITSEEVRSQVWNLGPSAVDGDGVVPAMLRGLGVPEQNQRIFQSNAAALEETKRSDDAALALGFTVSGDLAAGRLVRLTGPGLSAQGRWTAMALPAHDQPPAAAELLRFITTPRATQAMVRGAGVHLGRFKPAVHVTLWS